MKRITLFATICALLYVTLCHEVAIAGFITLNGPANKSCVCNLIRDESGQQLIGCNCKKDDGTKKWTAITQDCFGDMYNCNGDLHCGPC